VAEGAEGFPCVLRLRVSAMQVSVEFKKSVVLGRGKYNGQGDLNGRVGRIASRQHLALRLETPQATRNGP
jgi:hypothetical protein